MGRVGRRAAAPIFFAQKSYAPSCCNLASLQESPCCSSLMQWRCWGRGRTDLGRAPTLQEATYKVETALSGSAVACLGPTAATAAARSRGGDIRRISRMHGDCSGTHQIACLSSPLGEANPALVSPGPGGVIFVFRFFSTYVSKRLRLKKEIFSFEAYGNCGYCG